jgi:hypothetical protein
MELLLNILWLMLVLPAVVLWRRSALCSRSSGRRGLGRLSPFPSIVLLCCLLALLFPVVSASDDLHPIRAEMEESGPSKRTIRHSSGIASGIVSPTWSYDGGFAARLPFMPSLRPQNDALSTISEYLPVHLQQTPVTTVGGRAPPA